MFRVNVSGKGPKIEQVHPVIEFLTSILHGSEANVSPVAMDKVRHYLQSKGDPKNESDWYQQRGAAAKAGARSII